MSAKMEYKGKDVEEAISNACVGLNVEQDQLDIEIASTGSSGIFGFGRKKAVVRVSLKKDAAAVAEEGAPKKRAAKAEKKSASAPRESKREVVGDPVSAEEMEQIKDDLDQILTLMNCPSTVTMKQDENNKVHAHIDGDYNEVIIGTEGQTLDSLQYLLRKMVTRKFPQKILLALDAGDFRANRVEELQERALRLAQEVKDSSKTRTIPAINPAERRIVHMALQDDTEIRSRSVGDGLFKKVLIYLPNKGRKRSGGRRRRGNSGRSNR